MRSRALVATVLLLLPGALEAQRMPRGAGARRPPRAAPLPPQPAVVARAVAFQRSRVSYETYPLISYLQTPLIGNLRSKQGLSLGAGSRVDYRVTRYVSATMDLTSSSILSGGTLTAEFGTRIRPERTERRFFPFVDLRLGYIRAYESLLLPGDFIDDGQPGTGARYSDGFGGVAGVGMETALTRRFSLTTGASVLRGRMTAYDIRGTAPNTGAFPLTSYRLALGLRYNPVRFITKQESR